MIDLRKLEEPLYRGVSVKALVRIFILFFFNVIRLDRSGGGDSS